MPGLDLERRSLRAALAALARARLDRGEVCLHDLRSSSVTWSGGKLEASERRHDLGVGMRGFRRNRLGFAYTSGLEAANLRRCAEQVAELSAALPPDAAHRLAMPEKRPEIGQNHDPGIPKLPLRRKAELAAAVEEAARGVSKNLKTRESRYSDLWGKVWIAHSEGMEDVYELSRAVLSIEVIVPDRKGAQQTGYAASFAIGAEALDPRRTGREAAERARAKVGAKQPKTAATPILLDPQVTAGIFASLCEALHADSVLKGKSLFARRLGEKVASPRVTLIDDGRLPGGYASAPFDGEGVSCRETVLIRDGILRSFLHSTYTAVRMKKTPTGNALRESYTGPPRIDATNLYLKPSGVSRDSLIASVEAGIYVSEAMGLHTVDPISGDFSLGASGCEVRRGSLGAPLEKMAIAGNVLQLLGAVQGVADDLRFFPGGDGGATVLLDGMTVAGH